VPPCKCRPPLRPLRAFASSPRAPTAFRLPPSAAPYIIPYHRFLFPPRAQQTYSWRGVCVATPEAFSRAFGVDDETTASAAASAAAAAAVTRTTRTAHPPDTLSSRAARRRRRSLSSAAAAATAAAAAETATAAAAQPPQDPVVQWGSLLLLQLYFTTYKFIADGAPRHPQDDPVDLEHVYLLSLCRTAPSPSSACADGHFQTLIRLRTILSYHPERGTHSYAPRWVHCIDKERGTHSYAPLWNEWSDAADTTLPLLLDESLRPRQHPTTTPSPT
jgi:hypothetical protein